MRYGPGAERGGPRHDDEDAPLPGCGRWLLAAASFGLAVAIAGSFTAAIQASMLAPVLGIIVYAAGAIALAILTTRVALAPVARWALVVLAPLIMAAAVWYGVRLWGL